MKSITVKQLKDKKACECQVQLFQDTFGDTLELKSKDHALKLAKVMAQGFDFDWASENLLNDFKSYDEAIVPFYKAILEAMAPLWKACEEAGVPLYKAYLEDGAPLYEAYKEEKAQLFAEMYWDQ